MSKLLDNFTKLGICLSLKGIELQTWVETKEKEGLERQKQDRNATHIGGTRRTERERKNHYMRKRKRKENGYVTKRKKMFTCRRTRKKPI